MPAAPWVRPSQSRIRREAWFYQGETLADDNGSDTECCETGAGVGGPAAVERFRAAWTAKLCKSKGAGQALAFRATELPTPDLEAPLFIESGESVSSSAGTSCPGKGEPLGSLDPGDSSNRRECRQSSEGGRAKDDASGEGDRRRR